MLTKSRCSHPVKEFSIQLHNSTYSIQICDDHALKWKQLNKYQCNIRVSCTFRRFDFGQEGTTFLSPDLWRKSKDDQLSTGTTMAPCPKKMQLCLERVDFDPSQISLGADQLLRYLPDGKLETWLDLPKVRAKQSGVIGLNSSGEELLGSLTRRLRSSPRFITSWEGKEDEKLLSSHTHIDLVPGTKFDQTHRTKRWSQGVLQKLINARNRGSR